MTAEDTQSPGPLNNVIRIDDDRIRGHLGRVVRGTVEETLNALLDAGAPAVQFGTLRAPRSPAGYAGTTSATSRRRLAR